MLFFAPNQDFGKIKEVSRSNLSIFLQFAPPSSKVASVALLCDKERQYPVVHYKKMKGYEMNEMTCTCNSATLEAKFRSSVVSMPAKLNAIKNKIITLAFFNKVQVFCFRIPRFAYYIFFSISVFSIQFGILFYFFS